MKTIKMAKQRKFRAVFIFEDMYGREHKRTATVRGETPRGTYTKLKNENGMIEILEFREIK